MQLEKSIISENSIIFHENLGSPNKSKENSY